MTYNKGRKPENVLWAEMPVPNGNARQNKRTQVVSHKAVIGLRPCEGLVVVPADMGGGAVIEYHHHSPLCIPEGVHDARGVKCTPTSKIS